MSSSERLRNEKYFFYKYAKENKTKTKNLKKAVKTEIEKKQNIYFLWECILWVVWEQFNLFYLSLLIENVFADDLYLTREYL